MKKFGARNSQKAPVSDPPAGNQIAIVTEWMSSVSPVIAVCN